MIKRILTHMVNIFWAFAGKQVDTGDGKPLTQTRRALALGAIIVAGTGVTVNSETVSPQMLFNSVTEAYDAINQIYAIVMAHKAALLLCWGVILGTAGTIFRKGKDA